MISMQAFGAGVCFLAGCQGENILEGQNQEVQEVADVSLISLLFSPHVLEEVPQRREGALSAGLTSCPRRYQLTMRMRPDTRW